MNILNVLLLLAAGLIIGWSVGKFLAQNRRRWMFQCYPESHLRTGEAFVLHVCLFNHHREANQLVGQITICDAWAAKSL